MHVQQRRTGLGEELLHRRLELLGARHLASVEADHFGETGEVRVEQVGVAVQQALDLLFQLDEVQRGIVLVEQADQVLRMDQLALAGLLLFFQRPQRALAVLQAFVEEAALLAGFEQRQELGITSPTTPRSMGWRRPR